MPDEIIETIYASSTVRVHLTPFGAHVVREYLGKPKQGRYGGEKITMPLWEAIKILGPHSLSSVYGPLHSIEFDRLPSWTEKSYAEQCDGLRTLLCSLGVDVAYQAPETLPSHADRYVSAKPSRIPDAAGPWWFEDRVVEVLEENDVLLVRLGNGHRKPLKYFDSAGWGGPAIRDPRTVARVDDDGIEDIPF